MFPINVVEKETGISKYLLRMWERRYSFPRPGRDPKGERFYTPLDIEKLKLVKSLMQEGYRPSKIINQEMEELKALLKSFGGPDSALSKGDHVVILVTTPEMEQEVRLALKNQIVKRVVVISGREDLENLSL